MTASARFTKDQVTALAPDGASVAAGKGLANAVKWVTLGANDRAVWGECKGSGKKPYQTRADLSGPAFKCSCPSRKFPCKHALGLLYLHAADAASFRSKDPPGWVSEWLEAREQREEKKQERAEKKAAGEPADPEAKLKRERQRRTRMAAGLQQLNLWLCDILRSGLASLETKPHSFWQEHAARLVDAQAPGPAAYIERMQEAVDARKPDWPQTVLGLMGKMKLIVEGFSRFESLAPPIQADLRVALGWAVEKDEVLSQPEGTPDRWNVLGMAISENDKLREQRIWLHGIQSGRYALLLDFAYGQQPFEVSLAPGASFEAELAYYPGGHPLRALLKSRNGEIKPIEKIDGFADHDRALEARAAALSVNPWLLRFPAAIEAVRPFRHDGALMLRDRCGKDLPIVWAFRRRWELMAISGGHPVTVFGEWDDAGFMPLACWDESYHNLFFGEGPSG